MSTSIPLDSAFAAAIKRELCRTGIHRILETGTYDGMGSTQIFLDYCRSYPKTIFRTIECDPTNCEKAAAVCGEHLMRGLSIPRESLPNMFDIQRRLRALPDGISVDHAEREAVGSYFAETDKEGPDDLIVKFCREFGQPDFALLDSAGHVGQLEAVAIVSNCRTPLVIALDDTRHFKHWGTLQWMSGHPEAFTLLCGGRERNGWTIVRYEPKEDFHAD